MFSLLANIIEGLGEAVSTMGTSACVMFFVDEPECPKTLIK